MARKPRDDFTLRWAAELDEDAILDLIKIGDSARSTLGLLPHAVYHEAAAKNEILAALVDGQAAGYTLFRLPRDEVILTHLCVDPAYRRLGIANALVNEVSRRHRHRLGIKAKCRNDYNLDDAWRGLGFAIRGPAKGRGRDQAPMTVWWRDHGHPHLFTPPADEPTPVRVALDTNIVLDLDGSSGSERATRSDVLKAPHLADRIQLVVTHALERDIHDRADDQQHRLRAAKSAYPCLPTSVRAKAVFDQMLTAVQRELPQFPVTSQDTADLWHLAEAVSAGVDAFVTWDRKLRETVAPLAIAGVADARLQRFCVVDPDHLELHLDELADAAAYSPEALHGTELSSARAGANFGTTVAAFVQNRLGERLADLVRLERELARARTPCFVVRATEGAAIACYATDLKERRLEVPLLRVADNAVSETLMRALLWDLRKIARERGAQVVSVTDPYLSPLIKRVAETESYRCTETGCHAVVVDTIGGGVEGRFSQWKHSPRRVR